MIKLINIKKKFHGKLLFKKVNINIDKTGIYSFIGDNGTGKTTLLNIITKNIKPSKGKVINKISNYSFISQEINLIKHLTIKQHLDMFKIDYNNLKKVHLYKKLNNYPDELSLGQKQRIMCILTLYSNAPLIIADEPTSHLDEKSAKIVIKEIVKMSKNKIILLVSHDLELIKKCSTKIYKIQNQEINLIKDSEKGNLVSNRKKKIKFSKYIKQSLKYYKKINFLFKLIFLITFVLLIFSINFKTNINNLVNISKNASLDYNKFYLKQCKEVHKEIIFKKCDNIDENTLNLLNSSDHTVGYNYDLLLNSLYDTNKFNVINYSDYELKEGNYPLTYNEIIANSNHKIGEIITLDASKVISINKTDIYNKSLSLKVVGIVDNVSLINKDIYYLDYDLLEEYLKKDLLINNKKSLFDYFKENDFNDYKYVLYFKNIDIEFLENNTIEYLSASYEYHQSLQEISEQISEFLVYLNILIITFCFYYLRRLIKKKIKHKENEINFLKAMGIKKKKIINIISKEQRKLILKIYIISLMIVSIIFYLLFKNIFYNFIYTFLILFITLVINKKIIKKVINKRVRI